MKLSNRRRDDLTLLCFKLFNEAIGSPIADFKSHLSIEIEPALYRSAPEFLRDYWAAESFSKTPVEIGVNREAEALRSFHEAEDLCKASTARIFRGDTSEYSNVIRRVRRRIAWLLEGITPAEVVQRARWSGGATSSLPAALANPQNKWGLATHTTSGTTWWLQYWNSMFQDEAFRNWEVVETNRILTVPKNAKTDRVIAAEPDWNMFFQLGMGACIRRRLQRVGHLMSPRAGQRVTPETEAQARQKQRARIGSRYGNYATIDLRAASDSISLAVCDLLLPPKIFRMLCQLRSPRGVLPDGTTVTFEKISSMGNGTTFELETLLFWAIAAEVAGSEDVSVYGDDIIVPTDAAAPVLDALAWFGFRPNPKKTHTAGLFRESCGGHYFNGTDVTPPYFRKNLDRLTTIISGYNTLCQRVDSSGVSPALQADLMDGIGATLRRVVPRQLYGPIGLDGCLGVPFNEFLAVSRRRRVSRKERSVRRNLQVHTGLKFTESRPLAQAVPEWGLTHALYGAERGSTYNSESASFKVTTWQSWPWSSSYPF